LSKEIKKTSRDGTEMAGKMFSLVLSLGKDLMREMDRHTWTYIELFQKRKETSSRRIKRIAGPM